MYKNVNNVFSHIVVDDNEKNRWHSCAASIEFSGAHYSQNVVNVPEMPQSVKSKSCQSTTSAVTLPTSVQRVIVRLQRSGTLPASSLTLSVTVTSALSDP